MLNLGLGGYNTLQAVSTLEHAGIQFQPDLVVVGYCINDIKDTSPNLKYIQQAKKYSSSIYQIRLAQFLRAKIDIIKSRFHFEKINNEFMVRNENYIVDISDDIELKKIMKRLGKQVKNGGTGGLHNSVAMYSSTAHVGKLRYSLEKLKKLKDKYEFNVIVVIVPFLKENKFNRDVYQNVYNIVEHESRRAGFDVITAFQSTDCRTLLISEKDGIHPNALGHRLIATHLYEQISSSINKRHELSY